MGLPPDQFAGRGIARTFQHGRVFGNLSVLDNVLVGAHTRRKASRPRNLIGGFSVRSRALVHPAAPRAEERNCAKRRKRSSPSLATA